MNIFSVSILFLAEVEMCCMNFFFLLFCFFFPLCVCVCVLDSDECSFILICSVCGKKRHCNPVLQHRNTPLPIVYFSPPIPTPPPPATTAQGKTAQCLISTRALCDTRNPRQCCFSRYMQFSKNVHSVHRTFTVSTELFFVQFEPWSTASSSYPLRYSVSKWILFTALELTINIF